MPIEKTKCSHGYNAGLEYETERKRAKSACYRLRRQCADIVFDAEGQHAKWKNQIAQDLMTLLGRAEYFLETSGDESDIHAAKATLRIVKRVEEFEGIRRAK